MQMAPFRLLVYAVIGTVFGCLSAILCRLVAADAVAAAKAALTVDVIAAGIVLIFALIHWQRDHGPLEDIDTEDDEAFKRRVLGRIHRSVAVAITGVTLFGAVFGAFYAKAGGGYLFAGMIVGVATTLYGLRANLDCHYRPSLLMIIYLVQSGLIAWVTSA